MSPVLQLCLLSFCWVILLGTSCSIQSLLSSEGQWISHSYRAAHRIIALHVHIYIYMYVSVVSFLK
jgi:hypothetical protein